MTRDELIAWCQDYMGRMLDLPPEAVDPDGELEDFGLDSAAAVAMVLDIEVKVGRELDPSILFQHRTLRDLAAALVQESAPAPAPTPS